jgi:hypothetical protein
MPEPGAAAKDEKPLDQTELDAMFGPAPKPAEAPPAAKDESPPLTQEQLDKVLAQPEPEAVASVAEEAPAEEEAPAKAIEELPEPEAIPAVIAPDAEEAETRRTSWTGVIAAAAVVVLLIGAGAGLYFGRDVVMRMVPMTKEMYSMLGLGGEALGAGLDIRSVASERTNEGGTEVLAVRGVIANISTVDRPVPNLRVALFDASNRVVQSTNAAPAKAQLPPGGEIGFRVPLRDPSPLARRLEVTFVETGPSPNGAAPGAPAPAGEAKGPAPGETKGEPKGETKSGG